MTLPNLSVSYHSPSVLLTAIPNFASVFQDARLLLPSPHYIGAIKTFTRCLEPIGTARSTSAVEVVAIADSKNIVAERHCIDTQCKFNSQALWQNISHLMLIYNHSK